MNEERDRGRGDETSLRATVAAHRRSGARLLNRYLSQELGLAVATTHDFVEHLPANTPIVYLVRHPIETLWSSYRWFMDCMAGTDPPIEVNAALAGLSFQQYLAGEAGRHVGFACVAPETRGDDNPSHSQHDGRGMFYAPIRFWADHVRAFLAAGPQVLVVRYEDLLTAPQNQVQRVAAHLGVETARSFKIIAVSDAPRQATSLPPQVPAAERWSVASLELAHREAGDVAARLGYELPVPRRAPTALPRHTVRYVSRTTTSGISVAGRRCLQAMVAGGIDVVWEPAPARTGSGRRRPPPAVHEVLASRYQPDGSSEFTVLHTTPEFWASLRDCFPLGKTIGHTVWETEQVPVAWRAHLHTADELWVPTEWNRQVFESDQIRRPVRVVPHVITTDPASEPPLELPHDLTIFTTISAWHPRKRPDRAVEAFARAFTRDDPVMLIVKTPPSTDAWPASSDLERMTWYQLAMVVRQFPDPPRIVLVNEDFTDAEINGLLQRTDCYLSLSSSEGWGLGQFDAATFGKPVITTAYGGHLEFFGPTYPGLVPFDWEPVGESENSPHLETTMQWAAPDLAAAAAMMREVVDGTSPILPAAAKLAPNLRERYSPERVGRDMLALLENTR